MNTNKFILSGIAGGVAVFLLGYLIYGLLLMNFMAAHAGPATGVARDQSHLLFPYLLLGNVLYGFLLAYIFGKAGIATLSKGLVAGAIIGFLTTASYGLATYATTWMISRTYLAADTAAYTVISGLAGAVVAWVAGTGKKA